jgi:hypothetical protein
VLTACDASAHHVATMSTRTPPPEDSCDPPGPTLGDLLYADTSKTASPRQIGAGSFRRLLAAMNRHCVGSSGGRIDWCSVAMRIIHNRETAEEVTLDVFHDVWRRAATYDPAGGSVVGWIKTRGTRAR